MIDFRRDTQEVRDPMFNSGIDYLKRIDSLLKFAHESLSTEYNNEVAKRVIHQLFIELYPRIGSDEDRLAAEKKIKNMSSAFTKKYITNDIKENKLREALLFLNIMAHKYRLILNDKAGEDDAVYSTGK